MSEQIRDIRWVRAWPGAYLFTMLAVLAAVLGGACWLMGEYQWVWTPLERAYFKGYAVSGLDLSILPHQHRFNVLVERDGRPVTQQELDRGMAVAWTVGTINDKEWHSWLRTNIYDGKDVADLLTPALYWFAVSLALLLPVGGWLDLRRARERRDGIVLRGAALVSRQGFHLRYRRNKGVGWLTAGEPRFLERWMFPLEEQRMVRTERRREDHHFLLAGDTGAGKTNLIRQMMRQVRDRGEVFVAYDPAHEYVSEFLDPDTDVIINPFDARCPGWSLTDELAHEGEAAAIAKAMLPDVIRGRKQDPFFLSKGRAVLKRLLELRPSMEQLWGWLVNLDQEIDRLVRGSPVANDLSGRAFPQRAGIMGKCTEAGEFVELLARVASREKRWSAEQWVRDGGGSVFITSTPRTRDALRPLISVLLDVLVMKLAAREDASKRPVWVFADEVGALEPIPKLPEAITQTRKANLRLVVGIQGRTQVEARYDLEAEAMLSQPYTKVLMRMSEPKSAEWGSRLIGDQEAEDMREGRTRGMRDTKNATTEIRSRPAVMPSEIQNLPDGWGFLRIPGLCVKLEFPYIPPKAVHPGFVPCEGAAAALPELSAPVAAEEAPAEAVELPEWGQA
jgi:hypothetical protein